MVAEEGFENCFNFNLIRLKHASFHVRKVLVLKGTVLKREKFFGSDFEFFTIL
jgi:hypothetical protein